MIRRFIAALSLTFLLACSGSTTTPYKIGIDQSFFPLYLPKKEVNVLAYTNALLTDVGEKEGIALDRVSVGWDNLLQGLQDKKFDGIISSMEKYAFNEKKYSFSEPFLMTGPVLVVPYNSKVKSLKDLKDQELTIPEDPRVLSILEKYPSILTYKYSNIPEGIERVLQGKADAVLIPNVLAHGYIGDLYKDTLKIVTKPLTNEGLKLITLYEENEGLIKDFNKALKDFKKSGKLKELLKKWGLST